MTSSRSKALNFKLHMIELYHADPSDDGGIDASMAEDISVTVSDGAGSAAFDADGGGASSGMAEDVGGGSPSANAGRLQGEAAQTSAHSTAASPRMTLPPTSAPTGAPHPAAAPAATAPTSMLLAGEIGYSIGKVYTSLSGFNVRSDAAVGTVQLVLLGRWLEQRGYAFWSLGHCYSPEMDYKRRLGHRVLPRHAFLDRLQQVRGEFRARADGAATAAALVRGSVAIISGLQTKPELNGTRCTVLSRAENGERWVVELEGSPTTTLALNAGSLALVPAGGGGGGGGTSDGRASESNAFGVADAFVPLADNDASLSVALLPS